MHELLRFWALSDVQVSFIRKAERWRPYQFTERPIMRWLIAATLSLLLAVPAIAAERVIIILDGSGSMWAQIDGEARISIARDTLNEVLGAVPDDLELGFMSYGHREKGSCDDIEVLVQPAAGTASAIANAAAGINPKGKTPISAAVKMAAEDLRYMEEKSTVILITDGLETCEADPCALASELENAGVDFTTHVVGFGLTDEEGRQVACLAENTGGQYFQASDGDALGEALTTTVAQATVEPEPQPEPEPAAVEFNFDPQIVLSEGAEEPSPDAVSPVWEIYKAKPDGTEGEYLATDYGVGFKTNLDPGNYIVRASVEYARIAMPVTIVAGELADPLFNVNAGQLTIRPLANEGADPDPNAAVYTEFASGDSTTNYGETRLYVPAGETRATVTIGNGKVTETIAVAAGEEIVRDIIVGVGRATLNAFYVEGMRVEESGLTFNVVGAKKSIQGDREDFGTNYGPDVPFDLPAGDYVAVVSMDDAKMEMPFTVKVGEAVAVDAVLGAGVLNIKAAGADAIDIYTATKDIQGNRTQISYSYGVERNATIAAGDYTVVARMPDGSTKEAPATVVAGERTEITIE
jgi:Ca-activated chloride channel family protein